MEENIYTKLCIKCNQLFIGKGKGPDVCPECDKHYCDQEEFEYYHERGN